MDPMDYIGIGGAGLPTLFSFGIILVLWSLVWKGFALWYSAKRNELWWFIAFLLLNTLGILEIVYIFFIAKIPEFRKRVGLA